MFFFFFDEEAGTTEVIPSEQMELSADEGDFFDGQVRMVWHKQHEKWYFSIADVCQVLTDSTNGRKYWNKLKQRLLEEGNETVTDCHQLKMKAADGKMRLTDAADMEQLFRLIQSIPSPKAEPFKVWLAKVGAERIEEMADPEIAMDRAISIYKAKGYSDKWISQRLTGKDMRKKLTDEWKRSGVEKSIQYAALTDTLTKAAFNKSTREYKDYKGLKNENLRDNMTDIELAINFLAEASTVELSKIKNPEGFKESQEIAKEGGSVAGNARKELETKLGKEIVSPLNAADINLLTPEDI